ncbi:hypothetical protein F5Y18DRAFT_429165 [Xylariaceae sp. FL1019]|nr:hypothetical protein F5Y18DRAFT_429165 [Xylariaceae sp. FL1019]
MDVPALLTRLLPLAAGPSPFHNTTRRASIKTDEHRTLPSPRAPHNLEIMSAPYFNAPSLELDDPFVDPGMELVILRAIERNEQALRRLDDRTASLEKKINEIYVFYATFAWFIVAIVMVKMFNVLFKTFTG